MDQYLLRRSGLPDREHIQWGAHFCHWYRTEHDLLDALIPFFSAGLVNNEQCMWVVSAPLDVELAGRVLVERMPTLRRRIERGQMCIMDHHAWFSPDIDNEPEEMISRLIDAEETALRQGYAGLRAGGNTGFLRNAGQWRQYERYESRLTRAMMRRRIIAMCCYNFSQDAALTSDVVRNHQFCIPERQASSPLAECGPTSVVHPARCDSAIEQSRALEEQLQDAHRRLRDAERARNHFLARMVEQLAEPLQSATSALGLLRRQPSRGRKTLQAQVERMTGLLADADALSRLALGQLTLHMRPLDFGNIVSSAVAATASERELRAQRLEVQGAEVTFRVLADSDRMARVLRVLLINASQFSGAGADIILRLSLMDAGRLRCSVIDEGVGIQPERLAHIFDGPSLPPQPFAPIGGGLGASLSIARGVVREHGGSLGVTSPGYNRGSEFMLDLPLTTH
jgi:MEDS: MEthanogen/methylotroph, DcmR Sensory domain/Histidine kinase-, DNA gyrase B-, and HSP90-like ATPase